MSSPTDSGGAEIVFIPVRFIPPSTRTQQTFEQYIGVPVGSTYAERYNEAVEWLHAHLESGLREKYRPAAALTEYRIEFLPVTGIPRESSGTRGY